MRRISPMNMNNPVNNPVSPALRELLDNLRQAQGDLEGARSAFDNALDPELVEAAIYEIRAHQSRINYLLRRIKEQESADGAAVAAMTGGRRRWS